MESLVDVTCGSQLRVGSFVCFCKTRFAWRDGKDEDVLEVFVIKNGVFRDVRLVICPSILPLGQTVTMVSAPVSSRFTPAIARYVTMSTRGRSSIAMLVVVWR